MHTFHLKNNLAMRFLLLLIAAVDALGAQKPRPEVTQLATAGPAFFSLYAGGIFPFTVATDSSGNLYIAGTVQSNLSSSPWHLPPQETSCLTVRRCSSNECVDCGKQRCQWKPNSCASRHPSQLALASAIGRSVGWAAGPGTGFAIW
jgi:hypothetical protein